MNGDTLADRAGLRARGNDKMKAIIQNAAKSEGFARILSSCREITHGGFGY